MARKDVMLRQSLINLAIAATPLVIDGLSGPKTNARLMGLSASERERINRTIRQFQGGVVERISPSVPPRMMYSEEFLSGYLQEAEAIYNVSAITLKFILEHEASKESRDGTVFYDASSRMGSYRGLMQMGELAWQDAMALDASVGANQLVGTSFAKDAYDPRLSILACAAFNRRLRGYAKSAGFKGSFTKEIAYAMHNQGPGFIIHTLSGKGTLFIENQSPAAQRTYRLAVEQVLA